MKLFIVDYTANPGNVACREPSFVVLVGNPVYSRGDLSQEPLKIDAIHAAVSSARFATLSKSMP